MSNSSKTGSKNFHYRMTHKGFNYSKKDFWQPGDELTEDDYKLLESVRAFYQKNGYSPSKDDLAENVYYLKKRFRTWKNVLIAAGLPTLTDAETVRLRQKALEKKDCPQG